MLTNFTLVMCKIAQKYCLVQYLHQRTSNLANLLTQLIYTKTKSPQRDIPLILKAWNIPVLC